MDYSVTKNSIPLVWLDSNMIIALGKVRAGKDTTSHIAALHEVLKRKTQQGKLIVVEHEQRDELGSSKPANTVLSALSLGINTNHGLIQQRQDVAGVKAFINQDSQKNFGVKDFFYTDPNTEAAESRNQQFIISVRMPRTEAYKQDDKASRIEMSTLINATRQSNLSLKHLSKQALYEQHLANERHALRKALTKAIDYLVAVQNNQIPYDPSTYNKNYDVFSSFSLAWNLGGSKSDIDAMLNFYDSPYYWELPFHDVWIDLYSRRLTGVNGGGEIKQSDIKDITNIASMLPICHAVTLDRAMATLVEQSGLAAKYSTRIFSNRNITELLAYVVGL